MFFLLHILSNNINLLETDRYIYFFVYLYIFHETILIKYARVKNEKKVVLGVCINKISHEYIVLVWDTLFYYFKTLFIDTRRWFYTFYMLLILKHYTRIKKNNKHVNKHTSIDQTKIFR